MSRRKKTDENSEINPVVKLTDENKEINKILEENRAQMEALKKILNKINPNK